MARAVLRQGSMKIEDCPEAPSPQPTRGEARFRDLLKRPPTVPGTRPPPTAPPSPRPAAPVQVGSGVRAVAGPVQASPRGALVQGEHLRQVRQGLSAEAHRLQGVRGEAHEATQERVHHRLTELLTRELAQESAGLPPAPRETEGGRGAESLPLESGEPRQLPLESRLEAGVGAVTASPAPPGARAEARAEALLALIEKIEVFVRAQRPALALRVGGALDATVEVERTGAREVALRIQGHRGPLRAEDLARLKESLRARGLTLRALSST